MEYLSRSLNCATLLDEFNFHPKCQNLNISHMAFVDDLMIFTRGDYRLVQIMCNVLEAFGNASRLNANFLKSNIYLAGVDDFQRSIIMARRLAFQQVLWCSAIWESNYPEFTLK